MSSRYKIATQDRAETFINKTLVSPIVGILKPASDSTTAIQFDKADGTTNVLNVDTTNGNVGIGTTSPSALLDVYAVNGGSNLLNLETSTGNKVTVLNNGNVGIGTTGPGSKLDVFNSGSSNTNPGATFRDNVTPTYASNADNLLTVRGTGSTIFKWTGRITAGGDSKEFLMGEYNYTGVAGAGMAWLGAHNAALNAWADLYISPDGTTQKTYIGSIGGYTGGPALTVQNSNGNVGIGTTAPLSKLSINGGLHVGGDSDAGDNNILADGTITGSNVISTATVRLKGYTAATLPAGVQGDTAFVTDLLVAPAYLATIGIGGGSVVAPVFFNGSSWIGY